MRLISVNIRTFQQVVPPQGLDVQAAYFTAYSMWAEALPLEERHVEERQTVITVEIHGEERAEEEEEEEWFDARDELAFQSDSQEPGDEEEEEEWFDARDVFEGEITEAISTAGGLTQVCWSVASNNYFMSNLGVCSPK